MQAGAVFALEDRDWIFPAYRESAIGLLRGMPVSTVLSWWRGHPAGWWNPREYNVASICVPIATQIPSRGRVRLGLALKGEDRVALTFFGDGATSEGSFHEGATFASVNEGAGRPVLQQQPVGDLDTAVRADGRPDPRRQGDRVRDPGRGVDGGDALAVYEATRDAVVRARGAMARRSSKPSRTARRPMRRPTTLDLHRSRTGRGGEENECVGRFERYLMRMGVLNTSLAEEIKADALELMRAGIAEAEAEPPADVGLVFEHAYGSPPPSQAEDLAELRRVLGG